MLLEGIINTWKLIGEFRKKNQLQFHLNALNQAKRRCIFCQGQEKGGERIQTKKNRTEKVNHKTPEKNARFLSIQAEGTVIVARQWQFGWGKF